MMDEVFEIVRRRCGWYNRHEDDCITNNPSENEKGFCVNRVACASESCPAMESILEKIETAANRPRRISQLRLEMWKRQLNKAIGWIEAEEAKEGGANLYWVLSLLEEWRADIENYLPPPSLE
jgi:hypothetical protein